MYLSVILSLYSVITLLVHEQVRHQFSSGLVIMRVCPAGGGIEPVFPITKTIKELMKTCLQLSDPHVMERVTLFLHAQE